MNKGKCEARTVDWEKRDYAYRPIDFKCARLSLSLFLSISRMHAKLPIVVPIKLLATLLFGMQACFSAAFETFL